MRSKKKKIRLFSDFVVKFYNFFFCCDDDNYQCQRNEKKSENKIFIGTKKDQMKFIMKFFDIN